MMIPSRSPRYRPLISSGISLTSQLTVEGEINEPKIRAVAKKKTKTTNRAVKFVKTRGTDIISANKKRWIKPNSKTTHFSRFTFCSMTGEKISRVPARFGIPDMIPLTTLLAPKYSKKPARITPLVIATTPLAKQPSAIKSFLPRS